MICKNCGASLLADAKFCNFCGAPLESAAASEEPAFTSAASSPETQEKSYTVAADNSAQVSAASAAQNAQEASYSVVTEQTNTAATDAAAGFSLLLHPEESQSNSEQKTDDPAHAEQADADADEQAPASEEEEKRADEAAARKGTKPRTVALIALIEVIVLAAAVFVFFQFRTDTIHSVTAETLSINSVSVTVDSRNGENLEVICSTDAGEVERVPVTDSVAVFTDLEPGTSYTFEPASSKGKLLLSNTTATATTNQETILDDIAVTSYSATTATFSISGSGPVPDSWLVTLTAGDGTTTSETVSGTEFTFEDLTPQTTYTVTVERGDGEPVSGVNTCDFTTQGYTILSDFVKTSNGSDSIALAWSYSGTIPDSWTLSCTDSDGNSTETEATGTEYTLTGLTAGKVYTITLSCGSLQPTDADTVRVLLPGENLFTDVTEDSYCYAPVLWAYYTGITSGTSETQFSPDQVCTRAQVVTFLWRLAGQPDPNSTTSPFTDVTDSTSPTYNAIMWAVENGITSGTSSTTFSPDAQVTRAQAVTFLWRYAGEPEAEAAESSFSDVDSSDSMLKPIMWAVENGITSGTSSEVFSPNDSCTRGQVVTFMYRYLGIE